MCSLDVVSSVAYLAYLKPEMAKKINFTTEYLYSHIDCDADSSSKGGSFFDGKNSRARFGSYNFAQDANGKDESNMISEEEISAG
jgi:hypothetical protein